MSAVYSYLVIIFTLLVLLAGVDTCRLAIVMVTAAITVNMLL